MRIAQRLGGLLLLDAGRPAAGAGAPASSPGSTTLVGTDGDKLTYLGQRIVSIAQAPDSDPKIGRTYDAIMMTGEVITDFHTGRMRYAHQLDTAGNVRLGRMNSGRSPVVDTHRTWESAGQALGTVLQGSCRMTPEGLRGRLQLMPDDKLPEAIRNGLETGVLQNLSIQATVHGMTREESEGLTLARITDWEPFEVSLVAVGADQGARLMRIAQSIHGNMILDAGRTAAAAGAAPPPDADAIRQAERDRIAGIRTLCQSPLAGDADPQPFIDSGASVDQARGELWNRGSGSADPTIRQAAQVIPGAAAEDKMVTGIQHAFLERGDPEGVVAAHEKLTIAPGEYRGISLADAGRLLMGEAAARQAGYGSAQVAQMILNRSAQYRQAIGIPGMLGAEADGSQILGAQAAVRQAFGGVSGSLLGAQGRSDLSVVVENLMHRMLSAAYAMEGSMMAWQRVTKTVMAKDFRPQNHVFLGALPDFGTRSDTGDFPRAQIPNPEKATTQVTERGQTIVISRTTIIDDDLGVVFQTPRLQGMAAQRVIEHLLFALLQMNAGAGPTFGANSLFHVNNENTAAGAALSSTAVNADRTLLARQKMVGSADAKDQSVGGFDLFGNFRLDTYLIPLELETTLEVIRDNDKIPGSPDQPNTEKGKFRNIVATPLLTGTKRYGFSMGTMGGMNQSPICVSFYGSQAPYLFMSEISVGRGMVWHGAIDVGVDPVNTRGAVYNAGA